MLENGLYEELINHLIEKELDNGRQIVKTKEIDEEDSSRILSRYVAQVAELGFRNCKGGLKDRIHLTNSIIQEIRKETENPVIDDYYVGKDNSEDAEIPKAEQLLSVRDKENNLAAINDIEEVRPITSLVESSLFTGAANEPQMFTELQKEIGSSDRIDMIVSFIKWTGIRLIIEQLRSFTEKGGKLRIITTSYMGVTETKAIEALVALSNTEIKICYETRNIGLHAKSYIFYRNSGFSTAYVGSSNLTSKAVTSGLEWNLKITLKELPETFAKIQETFEIYWNSEIFETYSNGDTEKLSQALRAERSSSNDKLSEAIYSFDVKPYYYQQEILDKLEAEREVRGFYRNLVVAATGTGKTVISALDYRNYCRKRGTVGRPKLLFIAHREEILRQSMGTFRAVLRDANFGGLLVGPSLPKSLEHLFVSIQSLNSKKLTEYITADYYDYIVVDEFHHAAAPSYQKMLNYFTPHILLGLTATPERMDGGDILKYFNNRIAAEIRLPEAIAKGLLCPFQYFGVTDDVDLSKIKWTSGGYDKQELSNVFSLNTEVANRRAESILSSLKYYAEDLPRVKGLGFCVSVQHAQFMADFFSQHGIPSLCLTGNSETDTRTNAKCLLQSGKITFIFVVDIYNEGVDIPEVNTIMFLRPTESLTVFLQQLGRGLRLAENKDCLTVLDFIGQANQRYNFEDKFLALLTRTRNGISAELKNGFSSVPKGCYIKLEKVAAEYVLNNIRQSYSSAKGMVSRIASFEMDSGQKLTLTNFLDYYHMSPKLFYKQKESFSRLAALAQKQEFSNQLLEGKCWFKIAGINSRRWIYFLLKLFSGLSSDLSLLDSMSLSENRMFRMFCYTLWDLKQDDFTKGNVKNKILELVNNNIVLSEINELLRYNLNRIDFVDKSVLDYDIPLDLHCSYSRDQILVAMDDFAPHNMREGVKYFSKFKTDVFLITLNKSEKEYSPSTRYQDYSINENLFHWQSQSTTSAESATGQRYINQEKQGNTVLLFVRNAKSSRVATTFTENYTFLGKAHYASHTGSRPMNVIWRLEEPVPPKFLKTTSKLMVG
ncbi:DUF3427 domain-containing protein [Succinimonas amylolytica]|uniref:DUF3427 domain-containing protein n=1 Tax=Succinimonas amylolytica TaxID=83769 RepID=UPI0023A821D6